MATTSTAATLPADPLTSVVARLGAAQAPVLFVDTCALLDIVRAPCRQRTERVLAEVERLENAVRTHKAVLCAAEITRDEWARNIDDVMAQVVRAGRDADQVVSGFVSAARRTGKPRTVRTGLDPLQVPPKLRAWSERLLQLTTLVSPTTSVKEAAWNRQALLRAPAKRGKNNLGDCTITETILALGQGLATAPRPFVFLTSNTADFGHQGRGQLHPDLAHDFAAVGATAAFDWGWARNDLGL